MDKEEYQKLALRVKTFAEISDEPEQHSYWRGYLRGLRRLYYGDNFGTEKEHKQWLTLSDRNETDLCRRALGLGYKAGLIHSFEPENFFN